MKKLILIRHGEATHLVGENKSTGGWTDSVLTGLGKEQALRAGKRLANSLKTKEIGFYCSDLARAKETAEIIGSEIGLCPVVTTELRELNNGIAANLSRKEAEKFLNPITEPVLDWIPFENGESWRMLHERISGFMEKIKDNNDDVLIVSHGGPLVSITHWWLEFGYDTIKKIAFEFDPCSFTLLQISGFNEKIIVKLNDTTHLSGLDKT